MKHFYSFLLTLLLNFCTCFFFFFPFYTSNCCDIPWNCKGREAITASYFPIISNVRGRSVEFNPWSLTWPVLRKKFKYRWNPEYQRVRNFKDHIWNQGLFCFEHSDIWWPWLHTNRRRTRSKSREQVCKLSGALLDQVRPWADLFMHYWNLWKYCEDDKRYKLWCFATHFLVLFLKISTVVYCYIWPVLGKLKFRLFGDIVVH